MASKKIFAAVCEETGETIKGTVNGLARHIGVDKRSLYMAVNTQRLVQKKWHIVETGERVELTDDNEKTYRLSGMDFSEEWTKAIIPFKNVKWVKSGGIRLRISGYKRKNAWN